MQNVNGGFGDYYGYGSEKMQGQTHAKPGHAKSGHAKPEPQPQKEYGDWDKDEVSKYQKNQDLERRPTLGGSLLSLVKRFGSDRR